MRESIGAVWVGASSGWELLMSSSAGRPGGLATCASRRAAPGRGRGGGQSRLAGVVGGEGQGAALSRVAWAGARGGGGPVAPWAAKPKWRTPRRHGPSCRCGTSIPESIKQSVGVVWPCAAVVVPPNPGSPNCAPEGSPPGW